MPSWKSKWNACPERWNICPDRPVVPNPARSLDEGALHGLGGAVLGRGPDGQAESDLVHEVRDVVDQVPDAGVHRRAKVAEEALCWGFTGVVLGLHWGYTGVVLALYWGCTGVLLKAVLGFYWGCTGVVLGLYRGCTGVALEGK